MILDKIIQFFLMPKPSYGIIEKGDWIKSGNEVGKVYYYKPEEGLRICFYNSNHYPVRTEKLSEWIDQHPDAREINAPW